MNEERPIPPRLAVALHYQRGTTAAPLITAKGRGHMAERIISLAQEHDVAIEANPALAQALSGAEVDQSIPIELFEAVAEVIGFVLRARRKLE